MRSSLYKNSFNIFLGKGERLDIKFREKRGFLVMFFQFVDK